MGTEPSPAPRWALPVSTDALPTLTCPVCRAASSNVTRVLHNLSKEPSVFLIHSLVSSWGFTRNRSRAVRKTRSVKGDGARSRSSLDPE